MLQGIWQSPRGEFMKRKGSERKPHFEPKFGVFFALIWVFCWVWCLVYFPTPEFHALVSFFPLSPAFAGLDVGTDQTQTPLGVQGGHWGV